MINETGNLAKINGVSLVLANLDATDFDMEDKFDLILCNNVLHLINDNSILSVIENIKNHTNNYGINVISFPLRNSFLENFSEFRNIEKIYSGWKIIHYKIDYFNKRKFFELIVRKTLSEIS